MGTLPEPAGGASAAEATASAKAKRRRRLGLALLLAGLALAVGGFFLPWLSIGCLANCIDPRWPNISWPLIRGPVAANGAFLLVCDPAWGLVLVFALLIAAEEFRPSDRGGAGPALVLAAMLLIMQAIALVLTGFMGFSTPPRPVVTYGLLPGWGVSLLGTLFVAIGGWLRYYPRRRDPSRELAEVPAER